MKKSVCMLLCAVFCTLLSFAAGGKEIKAGTPAHCVKTFYNCMANGDFAKAQKLINTKELQDMIKLLEALVKETPDLKKDAGAEFSAISKCEIVSEKIDGNTAKVVISYQDKGKEKKDTVNLKKINGIWKIDD
ncbi:MAG: DUF4878 domain-containing protein [Lentisphaeria bacterium]|nr:DUF4878 domain-containing protein [Lentisphaeria bacterium]